jgi:hypothetical protein
MRGTSRTIIGRGGGGLQYGGRGKGAREGGIGGMGDGGAAQETGGGV